MFEMSWKEKFKQLFCRHNYFPVAVTEDYKEIGSDESQKVVVYKCDYCQHVRIIK